MMDTTILCTVTLSEDVLTNIIDLILEHAELDQFQSTDDYCLRIDKTLKKAWLESKIMDLIREGLA